MFSKLNKWAGGTIIAIVLTIVAWYSLKGQGLTDPGKVVQWMAGDLLFILMYWSLYRLAFRSISKKWPLAFQVRKRLFFQLLWVIVSVLIVGAGLDTLNYALPYFFKVGNNLRDFNHLVENSLLTIAPLIVIYNLYLFLHLYEQNIIENEQLKKEALVAQFEILKNQISPHFLFNSLNALITLIPKDEMMAVSYTQKLSNVYRRLLDNTGRKTISLSEELIFLADYIFIFERRFGAKMSINMNFPDDISHQLVVPFALQMLVENAVKHNTISRDNPLTIRLFIEDEHIMVENNLQVRNNPVVSTGIGLENITNRYNLLTGKQVIVLNTGTHFRVSLPLILKEDIHESNYYRG
ncbi:sensor histidine kinase [Mucilaginibacter sp. X5P1]|uniref:sensor histidine kinase n=1 Tax=Mucilaginibacter sp. X5P1 TaxID=2723088 RepID=UPI00160D4ACA|nr:histidine kinase [Mucilaginibacter sp. X5P1]MBB6136881.1 sensor histidine kinase YesM [Mucilaginibacter sp. X5P1]